MEQLVFALLLLFIGAVALIGLIWFVFKDTHHLKRHK